MKKASVFHKILRKREKALAVYLLLFLIAGIANFFYLNDFGLYEDDYAFVGYPMGYDLKDLLDQVTNVFTAWPQGRPLAFSLPHIIVFINSAIGDLKTVYIVGYFFVALNACLFYKLLKESFPEKLAFFAALTFCVFPADTTKTLLTHNIILQPALTFLLIAGFLYVSGKKKTSYLVIAASLMAYESVMLPFLAAPLLKKKWDKKLALTTITHLVILAFIIGIYAVIRAFMGEGRINSIGFSILPKIFWSLIIGPTVSITSLAYGSLMAIKALLQGNQPVILAITASTILFFALFYRMKTLSRPGLRKILVQFPRKTMSISSGSGDSGVVLLGGAIVVSLPYLLSFKYFNETGWGSYGRMSDTHIGATFGFAVLWGIFCYCVLLSGYALFRYRSVAKNELTMKFHFRQLGVHVELPQELFGICHALLVGIITLFLAYLLSFTHFPPLIRYGRLTSVHLAATFGGSLICGALCYTFFLMLSGGKVRRLLVTLGLSVFFALLVGYGMLIQLDFKQSWKNQRWFWSNVIEQCPDLDEGTMILVEKTELPTTKYIKTYSWADPHILEQIFRFPKNWKTVPRLWVVDSNWKKTLVIKNGMLQWHVPIAGWEAYWTDLPQDSIIILKMVNGTLSREYEPLYIGGNTLRLKKKSSPTVHSFEKGQLFEYLMHQTGL